MYNIIVLKFSSISYRVHYANLVPERRLSISYSGQLLVGRQPAETEHWASAQVLFAKVKSRAAAINEWNV